MVRQMATLKAEAVHGVKWTATSNLVVTILKYVRTIILARLLIPNDFGLMTMVTVVVGLGQAFSDMGISLAIVWKQDASRDELSSVYWFNIFTGVAVSGIVAAAAPLVVRFYNEPRLYNMILWMSPVFFITSIGIPFQMILQKELMFRRLALVEIVATVAAATVAVVTAFLGAGVYSLVWGTIIDLVMRSFLQTLAGWKVWHPGAYFRARDLVGYLRFGVFSMGDRLLNFYQSNIDFIILGKFLGGEMLGMYMIAYQMVVEPFLKLNPILTRVAFPIFAKRQEDDAVLRRGYCELSKMVAILTLPVLAIMAATANLFIPALFGVKWQPAIALVQILVILGAMKALTNPLGSILYAKGRTDYGFYWSLFSSVANTVLFWAFVGYGVYVIAWLEDGLSFLYLVLALLVVKRVIGLSLGEYARAVGGVLGANILIGVVVYAVGLLLRDVFGSDIALLVVLVALGLALYTAFLATFERGLFVEYWGILWRRRGQDEADTMR